MIGDGLPASATHPDDATLLNDCLRIAGTTSANVPIPIPVVSTGGGVILDNTTDIAVPKNLALTCGASTFDAGGNDYRIFQNDGVTPNLTKAIVLDPTNTNSTHAPLFMDLTAKNTTLSGCTIEAGAGAPNPIAGNKYPNPHSPSVFYPDCVLHMTERGFSAWMPPVQTRPGPQHSSRVRSAIRRTPPASFCPDRPWQASASRLKAAPTSRMYG